jgi:hypothetical protein
VSQKKCPKCGEDNPAEAVMCWACYTPLSAGPAPAAAGARAPIAKPGPGGPPGPGVGEGEEGEKKKLSLDPKVIGLLAFLFVGGGIAAFMNMGHSSGGDDGGGDTPADTPPAQSGGNTGGQQPAPQPQPDAQIAQSNTQIAPGTLPPVTPIPYTPVVPPNPNLATATIGIVPSRPNVTAAEAAGLARFAKNQYQKQRKWSSMQIFVFENQQTARAFGDYQARRRGAQLSPADYQSLANANVWSGTPACYEMQGKVEFVTYPSKSPSNWWTARRAKS